MTTTDMMCSLCGWRNPSWARVCGGCGKPLSSAVPTPADATVQAPAPPAPYTPSEGYPYGMPEARGPSVSPTQPNPALSPYAPGATAGAWSPAGRPQQAGMPRRSAGPRVLTALVIFLIVLLVVCAAAWALMIRPAVHNQVDAEVRSSLASTIRQIPQTVPPDEYAISAATVNANIQQQIPANSGVSSAQVHFQNGNVVLDYVYHGQSGAVTTQLVPVQGILVAQNTTVTGVLGWVESGDELQSALNDELPSVPSGYRVTGLRTANDTLYMKVNQ